MGLIDVDGSFQNSTKCSTWQDIKESHASDNLVELLLRDVYGMLILLSIGLTGSVLALAVEKAVKKVSGVIAEWHESIRYLAWPGRIQVSGVIGKWYGSRKCRDLTLPNRRAR